METSPSYADHWDHVYKNDEVQLEREWHCTYDRLKVILEPYLCLAASQAPPSYLPLTDSEKSHESHPIPSHLHPEDIGSDDAQKALAHLHPDNTTQEPQLLQQHKPIPLPSSLVVDVGCGSSAMGIQVLLSSFGFQRLLLLDASPIVLSKLRERLDGERGGGVEGGEEAEYFSEASTVHTWEVILSESSGTATIDLVKGDCRKLPIRDSAAAAVIDKGTMDALWSDEDKVAMLRECARVLARPFGVIVSISFSSQARLKLLWKEAEALGLQCRVYVVGDGDPAQGHEVRFLSLLARDFGQVSYQPDDLTLKLLRRIDKTGSLLCDEDEAVEGVNIDALSELFQSE